VVRKVSNLEFSSKLCFLQNLITLYIIMVIQLNILIFDSYLSNGPHSTETSYTNVNAGPHFIYFINGNCTCTYIICIPSVRYVCLLCCFYNIFLIFKLYIFCNYIGTYLNNLLQWKYEPKFSYIKASVNYK